MEGGEREGAGNLAWDSVPQEKDLCTKDKDLCLFGNGCAHTKTGSAS